MRDGATPNGWSLALLGDHLDRVVGGGTPSRKRPDYWAGGIPWASVKDMTKPRLETTEETISEAGLAASATNLIPPGTIVLVTRMAVGAVARTARPTAINQDLKALFPKSTLSADYLFYLLQMHGPRLALLSPGTTVSGLRLEALRALAILVPPLPEQRKIADILSSEDDAIEKTEAVIGQVRRLKRGLAQQLLTRGLPDRHTRFKQSEIGELPEDWEVVRLGDLGTCDRPVVRTGPFGSSLKSMHFTEEGVPVLTIASLGEGEIIREGLFYVPPHTAQELNTYRVRTGDIVFSRVADVGRSVIIPPSADGWLMSSNLIRISVDRRRINPSFLMCCILYAPAVTKQVGYLTANGGRQIIPAPLLKRLLLPLPGVDEQQRTVDTLIALDRRTETERTTLSGLGRVKQHLAHVLLTGQVRVKVPTAPSAPGEDRG